MKSGEDSGKINYSYETKHQFKRARDIERKGNVRGPRKKGGTVERIEKNVKSCRELIK